MLQLVWCIDCVATTTSQTLLHWLHLPERVNFKVADMVYRVLHGLAPPYLSQLLQTCQCVADYGHRHHSHFSFHLSVGLPLGGARFL